MSNLVIHSYNGEDLTFRVGCVYGPNKRYIRDLTFLINCVNGEAVIDVSERYGDGRRGYGGGSYLFPLKFEEAVLDIKTAGDLKVKLCSALAEHEYREGVQCSNFRYERGSGARYFNIAQALRDVGGQPRFNQALIKQFMIKGCKGKIYSDFETAFSRINGGFFGSESEVAGGFGVERFEDVSFENLEELEEIDSEEHSKMRLEIIRLASIAKARLEVPAWERRLRHKVARGLKKFAGKLEKYN